MMALNKIYTVTMLASTAITLTTYTVTMLASTALSIT